MCSSHSPINGYNLCEAMNLAAGLKGYCYDLDVIAQVVFGTYESLSRHNDANKAKFE